MTNTLIALALTLVMGGAPAWSAAAAPPDPRSALLESYYKGYVDKLGRGTVSYVKATPFHSASLKALLESNKQACAAFSRGDDICGFGADGDMLLDAQDMAEGLVFNRMAFKAVPMKDNVVDVSFTVFPANPKAERGNLRYVMVEEGGAWRVDDIQYRVKGKFSLENTMRRRIADENAALEKNASAVKDAAGWLAIYTENPMPLRFARFVGYPLHICAKGGPCQAYTKKNAPLRKLVGDINSRYYAKAKPRGGIKNPLRGAAQPVQPAQFGEGSVVKSGPFDFTFRQKAWWLTKVDWNRPG